jgi:nitrite reductase (NADH) large subunit
VVHVVIVGCGVAGATAAMTISESAPETDVSVCADENHLYYPRPRLYEVISGHSEPQEIYSFPQQSYEKRRIHVFFKKVLSIDLGKKQLLVEDDSRIGYDKLILSNGARPFVPPIKGVEKRGVFTLRKMADALAIREYVKKTDKAIVIGGGLLGLEFAACLRNAGQQVEVVEINPRLLPNQLDQDGAAILEEGLKAFGIKAELDVEINEILGTDAVSGVSLDNGEELSAGLVLIAAGIRSNVDPAADAGIKVNKGVIVDQYLQTSADDVYAAGDVSEFNGRVYGIIPPAVEQAKIASVNALGKERRVYGGTVLSTTLKIANISLISMGLVNPEGPQYEEIKKVNRQGGVYKKVVLKEGKIVGAIILGDRRGVPAIKRLMDREVDVTKYKDQLLEDDFDAENITRKTLADSSS